MSADSVRIGVPVQSEPPGHAASGGSRRWWVLGVVGLAQLMVVLDSSIVNIALPSAQKALGFSTADRQWVVLASGGLFSIVFGFSHAETSSWSSPETLGLLAGGIILLALFTVHQTRSSHPLLPLRILADRTRAGSFLAVLFAGAGMFGVFLFLTYYVQSTLGYSALKTGLAFLPMVAVLMATSTTSSQYLAKRVGPRWIVMAGMLVAAAGMVLLTQIGVASGYDAHILPGLLCVGVGIGLIFSSAMNQATSRLRIEDAGVGSAMVTTMQQLGGSMGTSLLNTLAASATAAYVASRTVTAHVIVQATVHGYVTAFWWSAAIFLAGSVICGALLTGRVPAAGSEPDGPTAA
jgi:hypothetical protein